MRVLTVDVGTSRGKAALYDDQVHTNQVVSLPTEGLSPDGSVDPARLVRFMFQLIRAAMERADASPDVIAVTTIYGHVFLDADYQPIGSGLAWNHNGAVDYVESVTEAYAHVGADPGRPIGAEHLGPRLLWLMHEFPGLFQRIRWVIGIKDYLVWALTGALCTDYSQHDYAVLDEAVATRIIGSHPPWRRRDAAGAAALLPAPEAAHRVVGTLQPSVAADTDLPAGIPVVCGTSDGSAAMYGTGVLTSGTIAAVTGSTDVLMTCVAQHTWNKLRKDVPVHTMAGLSRNRAMVGDDRLLVGGSTGTSGAAIWWVDQVTGCDRVGARHWTAVDPGSEGLFVAPGLSGERAPFFTGASAQIRGITSSHDGAAIARAVREAVCYRFAAMVSGLAPLWARTHCRVVAGGGQSNPSLDRLRATVTPCEFARTDDPQSSLRGSAMFAVAALESDRRAADTMLIDLSQAVVSQATVVAADRAQVDRYQKLSDDWNIRMREET